MTKLFSFLIALILFFESIPIAGAPTFNVDAGSIVGETTTRATGFLYGLAEKGVPSEAITDSLKISSVSQKVPGGLQHPTGDVENIQNQLDTCDYVVVYLQDTFDTWYYCYDEIMKLRAEGTYNWKDFLYQKYLPIVEEKVRHIESQSYKDNIVYCIFNECDNAVWFGNYVDGVCHYDDIGRANFYEAWKITYDLVKSIAPEAKIGGPGFCDYVTDKIEGFMRYTAENACVPEIMIYHELSHWSIADWEIHVEDYRRIEKSFGIAELPIIVTEYGTMEECGEPSVMLQYIAAIERTGTWGNMAFWRLSDNLNDTVADDNSPNSNWWLYRKYAEMSGQHRLESESTALRDSLLHDGGGDSWRKKLDGVASLSEDKTEINVIINGSKNERNVKITNLDKTALGEKVTVKVECVYYEGLMGIVSSPIPLRQYTKKVPFGNININIPGTDTNTVYFVSVIPEDKDAEIIRNTDLPVRYEFEQGKLLGDSYTYDSAYATTGDLKGMVGGLEKEGDGVKVTFKAPEDGVYDLKIIFGKHNDSWGNPQGRDFATAKMVLDGKESELKLENTIKSEYTASKTITAELKKGCHTIEFYHSDGTFVLDSMLVALHKDADEIAVLENSENGSAFLAIAPADGYYKLSTKGVSAKINVDGAETNIEDGDKVYLRRGVNEISFDKSDMACAFTKTDEKGFTQTVKAEDITLSGKAQCLTDKYGVTYIDNISNLGGEGKFTVNVPEDGDYRVTLLYANNSEGGVHSYNVDLIERYVTVSANGKSEDIFCRNTYSRFTYKTMTFNLELKAGENEITLTNSGNTVFHNMEAFAPQIAEIRVSALK